MPAGPADPQVEPRAADPKAVLAAARARLHLSDVRDVSTGWRHRSSPSQIVCGAAPDLGSDGQCDRRADPRLRFHLKDPVSPAASCPNLRRFGRLDRLRADQSAPRRESDPWGARAKSGRRDRPKTTRSINLSEPGCSNQHSVRTNVLTLRQVLVSRRGHAVIVTPDRDGPADSVAGRMSTNDPGARPSVSARGRHPLRTCSQPVSVDATPYESGNRACPKYEEPHGRG